jgi:hypothetical protein
MGVRFCVNARRKETTRTTKTWIILKSILVWRGIDRIDLAEDSTGGWFFSRW